MNTSMAARRPARIAAHRNVEDAYARQPREVRDAMCRILGVDLGQVQARWLGPEDDELSIQFFDVVIESYQGRGMTAPQWSVVLRAFGSVYDGGETIDWVMDVVGFRDGAVRGIGPSSADILAMAITRASVKLSQLREVCGAYRPGEIP